MNFLKEIEAHLETFETKAKSEILSFIAHVKSKYSEPAAAIVPPPAPIAPNGELTIAEVVIETPVASTEIAEPVIEATPVETEIAPVETAEPTQEK
jgi:hypothetical protein